MSLFSLSNSEVLGSHMYNIFTFAQPMDNINSFRIANPYSYEKQNLSTRVQCYYTVHFVVSLIVKTLFFKVRSSLASVTQAGTEGWCVWLLARLEATNHCASLTVTSLSLCLKYSISQWFKDWGSRATGIMKIVLEAEINLCWQPSKKWNLNSESPNEVKSKLFPKSSSKESSFVNT